MKEIWKDIAGYKGLYQVSNLGNIKSVERRDKFNRKQGGFLLKQGKTKGYYKVELCKEGKVKSFYVHKLVAEAFIPNPNNLPEVGHKDELNLYNSNECNNNVNNLYWTSSVDNSNMPHHRNRISKTKLGAYAGGKNPFARKVICDKIIFDCVKDCAEYYGYRRRTMSAWLEGRNKMPDKFVKLGLKYFSDEDVLKEGAEVQENLERDTWLEDMLKEENNT